MSDSAFNVLQRALAAHWLLALLSAIGFALLYYAALLLMTMLRFQEVPNYYEVYDIIGIYGGIFGGTPSLVDAFTILLGEPWFETGYKNPEYYGVATWSYMLIPPKMLLVFLFGVLLGVVAVLLRFGRETHTCSTAARHNAIAATGIGGVLVSLTSATLTWVVCCATPSWVVALAMLGMSASLALWLEPLGILLMVLGLGVMVVTIIHQLRSIASNVPLPSDT